MEPIVSVVIQFLDSVASRLGLGQLPTQPALPATVVVEEEEEDDEVQADLPRLPPAPRGSSPGLGPSLVTERHKNRLIVPEYWASW